MSGAATISVLRCESVRMARTMRSRVRLAGVIAIPVALAIVIAMSRTSSIRDPADAVLGLSFDRFVVTGVLGLVLLQVGLVSAAGALVGATRTRHEFAIYLTNGASPGSLVLSAAMMSALLGALGAVIGVGAGLAIVAALSWVGLAEPVSLESLSESIAFFSGCGLIAIVTSGAAGALPAWIAARAHPRAALLSAAPRADAPRPGLAVIVTAVAVLSLLALLPAMPRAIAVVASILAVLSWFATIPAQFSALSRVPSRLPLPFRLAARNVARMRERFTPGVAASAVSLATAIALATVFAVVDARARSGGETIAVDSDRGTLVAIVALCVGAATAITLLSNSLAALESEADARTLAFLGAEPVLVRRCAAATAAALATIAALCAIPIGSFIAVALLRIADTPLAYRAPPFEIFVLCAVVPVVAYAAKRFGPAPRPPPPR
jgi:FtsX-like permease family